jgi:glutamate decarboxylase
VPYQSSSSVVGTGDMGGQGAISGVYVAGLPVVVFRFKDEILDEFPQANLDSVSRRLRERQWAVSHDVLSHSEDETEILRIVISESMSCDQVNDLACDLFSAARNIINRRRS